MPAAGDKRLTSRHRFLQDVIYLDSRGKNQFVSTYTFLPTRYHPGGYGGDLLAQCAEACRRTVEEDGFVMHSVHGYFLRPRKADSPVTFQVTSLRDSTAFASRSVLAHQDGKIIFSMQASFHHEKGETPIDILKWQYPEMPIVKAPEDLESMSDTMTRYKDYDDDVRQNRLMMFRNINKLLPVELRSVCPESSLFRAKGQEKLEVVWIRMDGDLGIVHFNMVN